MKCSRTSTSSKSWACAVFVFRYHHLSGRPLRLAHPSQVFFFSHHPTLVCSFIALKLVVKLPIHVFGTSLACWSGSLMSPSTCFTRWSPWLPDSLLLGLWGSTGISLESILQLIIISSRMIRTSTLPIIYHRSKYFPTRDLKCDMLRTETDGTGAENRVPDRRPSGRTWLQLVCCTLAR